MENFPYLPQELVEKILVRLPCKSLIRFKCVCKHWCALFHKDTKFLSHHVSHFLKNQNSAVNDVLLTTVPSKLFSLSTTGIGMEAPIPTFKSHSKKFQICGHSNGIVCLSTADHAQVLLYNPLTREFRHLPGAAERFKSWSSPVAVGMGYDSSTNDFKVIRIQNSFGELWAEQYTLSTDSWTVLPNTNIELFDFESDSLAMCFKRTFYWWAWCLENYSFVILALNMDDGVFQIVPKPPDVLIGQPHARSLTVWNDSISLVCRSYHTQFNVEIWVMDEFGSWTLMRTIKHLTKLPKPLVFWKGNELLMMMAAWGEIKSYNVDTEEIEDVLHTDGLISDFQVVNYVASLVPLKGENL